MTDSIPTLPRSSPRAEGIDPAAILAFIDDAEAQKLELHSMMVLRHGSIVAEGWWTPFRPEDVHILFSLTKSFTSAAIGLLISEGRLSLEDKVIGFFPDDCPLEPSWNLQGMRIRDLLTMATGQDQDEVYEPDRMRQFLAQPVPFEPGTHFFYNSSASNALSSILHKVAGESLESYLKQRLFEPLGIGDYDWEAFEDGTTIGGWGLRIQTESIAKFGQMLLQGGSWNGVRLLPAAWVEDATRSHVDNSPGRTGDWAKGYGYQFWRCSNNGFRGDGAFGQYCVVLPDQDMVVAITSCVDNMQAVLDLVWQHLVPSTWTATEHTGDLDELERRLGRLVLPGPNIASSLEPGFETSVREFAFDDEARWQFRFSSKTCELSVSGGAQPGELTTSSVGWTYGDWSPIGFAGKAVAHRGGWSDAATYAIEIHDIHGTATRTIDVHFARNEARISVKAKGWFGIADEPVRLGKLIS